MNWLKEKGYTRTDNLRGWSIYRSDFHGKEHWVARRAGVSMNINSYDGIIKMILDREEGK
jgi:hypothetical protein